MHVISTTLPTNIPVEQVTYRQVAAARKQARADRAAQDKYSIKARYFEGGANSAQSRVRYPLAYAEPMTRADMGASLGAAKLGYAVADLAVQKAKQRQASAEQNEQFRKTALQQLGFWAQVRDFFDSLCGG